MAARSDQPVNTPRIYEVQDPATNAYTVMVLMPTQLASKYPSKPWGTAIEDIGLSKRDSDLYPGYVLVDFEPMKGSADLFWIFQKLPGLVVTESTWDHQLGKQLKHTQQLIHQPDEDDFDVANASIKKVSWGLFMKEVEEVPTDALAEFHLATPTRISLGDLPRELLSVNIVWSSQYSIGTQDQTFYKTASGTSYSLSGQAADSASSSASISPEVQFRYRDIATNNLFGTKHEFCLPNPVTVNTIIARLNTIYGLLTPTTVSLWPVFHPESATITASGQSIRVSCNASAGLSVSVESGSTTASGTETAQSDDFSVGLSHNSVDISPCIHGPITFTGGTSNSQLVGATALISLFHSRLGNITSIKSKSGTAYGTVTPTSLPATQGTNSIPTSGLFITDFDVVQYKWDRCMVRVIVFDANSLA